MVLDVYMCIAGEAGRAAAGSDNFTVALVPQGHLVVMTPSPRVGI